MDTPQIIRNSTNTLDLVNGLWLQLLILDLLKLILHVSSGSTKKNMVGISLKKWNVLGVLLPAHLSESHDLSIKAAQEFT